MTSSPNATNPAVPHRHPGPHLGALAIVYMVLFLAGLYQVISFSGGPHFPSPWASSDAMAAYFQANSTSVLLCAFLQLGATIPLGIYTATIVSRLKFLGVRAAGVTIALFGGFATAFSLIVCANVLWTIAQPGVAQDGTLVRALYYISYSFGGPGFSMPMGLFLAGVSITAGFRKLLPKWIVVFGLLVAVCGELSWFSLIIPKAGFFIPLTRFPGFVWLIAVGFLLPRTVTRRSEAEETA